MGVISILLGIIAMIVFVGAGAFVGNVYIDKTASLSKAFVALQSNSGLSDTTVMIIFIGVFGFIGLLIGYSLIMHGVNYNKLCKIQKRIRRL